jgi:hypothetical protein
MYYKRNISARSRNDYFHRKGISITYNVYQDIHPSSACLTRGLIILLNNPNTRQFHFGPYDEHNIFFQNMNDTAPFQEMVTNKKGPTSRLKVVLKQFLCSLPARVCGPTCIMWRLRFRKIVCVKHIPSLDYKNRNRKT